MFFPHAATCIILYQLQTGTSNLLVFFRQVFAPSDLGHMMLRSYPRLVVIQINLIKRTGRADRSGSTQSGFSNSIQSPSTVERDAGNCLPNMINKPQHYYFCLVYSHCAHPVTICSVLT